MPRKKGLEEMIKKGILGIDSIRQLYAKIKFGVKENKKGSFRSLFFGLVDYSIIID
jgi:L-ribulose-5-phosphate 3-epimerase UlaE